MMNTCRLLFPLLTAALLVVNNAVADEETLPLAPISAAQIESLGMRVSDVPSSELPGYRKLQRVLVMSAGFPGIREGLQAVAPGVEFDIYPSSRATGSLASDYDAVVSFNGSSDVINTAESPAWVHTYSAGIDRILTQPVIQRERPIMTNSSGTTAVPIADHTIGMMFAHARKLHLYRDRQPEGIWRGGNDHRLQMWTVSGKTMLVLGLGAIGSQVAQRAHALGMRVTAVRNSSRSGPDYVDYVGLSDETLALAAEADVVVNALPLTPQTRGLVDREFFQAMKPTGVILNIGRGPTINTDDLVAAIRAGEIAGAGLDVTDPEPLPADHPLWALPEVLITPHVAGGGRDMNLIFSLLIENVRRYQAGEPLVNMVDIDAGY